MTTRPRNFGWTATAALLALATWCPPALGGAPRGSRPDASPPPADRPVPAPRAAAPKPQAVTVNIRGMAFTPRVVTLRPGDSVTWVNGDDRDHTVTAADGAFNSGNIRPGGSFTFRFPRAGNYPYSCSLHPRMRGTVSVQ